MARKRTKSEEPKKNVKSEEPKKKRPISLNILEIAKRLQKIEEIISTPYTLPTASADTKGGVKVGNGLTMTGEVLSADPVNASDVSYSTGTVKDALDGLQETTLTFTTTDYSKLQGNCVTKKQGSVVSLQFKGFKNVTADTYNDLFALPTEYRPSSDITFNIIPSVATFSICRIRILASNGNVQVYPYGSTAASYAVNAEDVVTYLK